MQQSTTNQSLREQNRFFSLFVTRTMWGFFLLFLGLLIYSFYHPISWSVDSLLKADQLSLVISTTVMFFTSIVLSYAARYMAGFAKLPQFLVNGILFAMAVIFMVIADHFFLFVLGWFSMGWLMAKLIGGYTHYIEGQASRNQALKYFLISTFLLLVGFLLFGYQTGHWSISDLNAAYPLADSLIYQIGGLLIIAAAVVQSALFPLHRWLMSSMTAPTPASALMHAGFVNAGAILLTRVAPIITGQQLLWILVLVGGFGALVSKFSKFAQPNVKQKLACSTSAQMGFMLLQCGLGFFAAAITHLILHGFYKANLFLSAGDAIEQRSTRFTRQQRWRVWYIPMALVSGLIGGIIFAYTTGKGLEMNSGLFLTGVIVLTVIHGTLDILRHSELTALTRLFALPVMIIPALLAYALFYNGIAFLLQTLPMVNMAQAISWDQLAIGALYLVSFVIIELELYTKSRRLYVHLLNISQPKSETILQ